MHHSQLNSVESAVKKDHFQVADLSGCHCCDEIRKLEEKMSQTTGKQISLVAYESQS